MTITTPDQRKSCTCDKCVSLCKRNPGWMTPEQAKAAIDAGWGARLMRDWLEGETDDEGESLGRIYVLCPASEGCEGDDAPEFSMLDMLLMNVQGKGRCTFLDLYNRCAIHASGFKPAQCCAALGCAGGYGEAGGLDNYAMAELWDNPEAQDLVYAWQESQGH